MKPIALLFTGLFLLFAPLRMVGAAELIMVEQTPCGWCDRWNADVGVDYASTTQGRMAPLRRIDMHQSLPSDLEFIGNVRGTPTFVLVDEGKEIGRIRGYPGADNFWGLLKRLLEKLPDTSDPDKPLPIEDWSRVLPLNDGERSQQVARIDPGFSRY